MKEEIEKQINRLKETIKYNRPKEIAKEKEKLNELLEKYVKKM